MVDFLAMKEIKKIIIGDRVYTVKEYFEEKEEARKERARLSFSEKIKQLIELQKIVRGFGKDILIWRE